MFYTVDTMARVGLLYLIIVLHLAGILGRFYWTIPHYDKAIHFLGGFWVAMMVVYLLKKYSGNPFRGQPFIEALSVVGIAMLVGFGWEGYEFLADLFIFHRPWLQANSLDTMTDLLADFLGAAAYGIIIIIKRKNK